MAKIDFENELLKSKNYYDTNAIVINKFLYAYFEIESLIATKFPVVKEKPSSNKSEIKSNEIIKKFNWDENLVRRVFYGKEGQQNKSCRILRNHFVHNFSKRYDTMVEIVERNDELCSDIDTLKSLILSTDKPNKENKKKMNLDEPR